MVEQNHHIDNVAQSNHKVGSPELSQKLIIEQKHSKRRSKSACPIKATFA